MKAVSKEILAPKSTGIYTKLSIGAALFIYSAVCLTSSAGAVPFSFDQAREITFEVPKGWTACDYQTREKLQGPSPVGRMKEICDEFDDSGGAVEVADPEASILLSFVLLPPSIFPSSFVRNITQEQFLVVSSRMCTSAYKDSAQAAKYCKCELVDVGNRRAIVGRFMLPYTTVEFGRNILVPGDSQTAAFYFVLLSPSKYASDQMDAIIASIHIARVE